MLMRKVNAETEIDGYSFKSGSIVIYGIYNIHHNKTLWTDPEKFNPERFLSEKNHRFSFLPFGTGERVCIGNHFAILESQLLLSMIIQQFDIQLTSAEEVEMELAVSLRPKGGIPVLLKRL
jgi:cytochrome P450